MKIDRKKLFFAGAIGLVLTFIIAYWLLLQGEKKTENHILTHPEIPQLEAEKPSFDNRLEAVDQIKEERERPVPAIYEEKHLDSQGNYDPYLEEKEKQVLMDSILALGPDREDYGLRELPEPAIAQDSTSKKEPEKPGQGRPVAEPVALGAGHQEFFLTPPGTDRTTSTKIARIPASVNGTQVVKKSQRLELRLEKDAVIGKDTIKAGAIFYAACSFRENRLFLTVFPNERLKIPLEAYDISDGQAGIYIENSFQGQATTEVIDDVIQDINISGVPQVRGLKSIFKRSNRNTRVKVLHQYQLILKPTS